MHETLYLIVLYEHFFPFSRAMCLCITDCLISIKTIVAMCKISDDGQLNGDPSALLVSKVTVNMKLVL